MTYQSIQTFEKKSSELYSLAFLLTGNADRSVEAFARALDLDDGEDSILSEFMSEWGRKLIVIEALGAIRTELRASSERVVRAADEERPGDSRWQPLPRIEREDFEQAVLAIDALPRCAMLLTIFEGISVEETAVLLDEDEAVTRLAQRLGIVQLTRNLAVDGGRHPVPVLSLN